MALSAASPIYRGFLTEVDCRWNIISGAVDDRTQEERGMDVSSGGTRLLTQAEGCRVLGGVIE